MLEIDKDLYLRSSKSLSLALKTAWFSGSRLFPKGGYKESSMVEKVMYRGGVILGIWGLVICRHRRY